MRVATLARSAITTDVNTHFNGILATATLIFCVHVGRDIEGVSRHRESQTAAKRQKKHSQTNRQEAQGFSEYTFCDFTVHAFQLAANLHQSTIPALDRDEKSTPK